MFEVAYSDKFGFVQEEVEGILAHHKFQTSIDDIAKWYDSYAAGNDVQLYNPWSIINICKSKELTSYWVETGMFCFIHEFLFY